MVIVVTDGTSQDDVKIPAGVLRQKAQVFAVGIGLNEAKGALRTIMDIGGHEHNSFNVKGGFDGLRITATSISDLIKHTACKQCVRPDFDPKQGAKGAIKPFGVTEGIFYFPNGTVWTPPKPTTANIFGAAILGALQDLEH